MEALIKNARAAQAVRAEFGSLCSYFWNFTDGRVLCYEGHGEGHIPVSNGLSARISADLKRRGFSFVGPVTVYSHLQACGIINDHALGCPRHTAVMAGEEMVALPPDDERGVVDFGA